MPVLETIGAAAGKGAVTAAASGATAKIIKKFVSRFLEPRLAVEKAHAGTKEALQKYLKLVERASRHVPTIAIQGSKFLLDDVYEPLTLVRATDSSELLVDGFPNSLFDQESRILITDNGGMGKSTLSKFILRRALIDLEYFPVIVELRKVKAGQPLREFICDQLLGTAPQACRSWLQDSLASGGYLIILDGYDEVNENLRPTISAEISKISAELSACPFLLTSRPDSALHSFVDFDDYRIRQLQPEEAYSLLRRYDAGRGKADGLIAKVQAANQVEEFLGTPLLVTLLYKAYDYKANIPLKRHIFFRQVYEALFQDHDLSKEGAFERRKRSSLDVDDFHKVMRAVGVISFRTGAIQYGAEQFHSLLRKAATISAPVVFDPGHLKYDLLSAVPLFLRDGAEFRWSHKAFQDYFTASFIFNDLEERRVEFVRKLFDTGERRRYLGILSILAELDVELIRASFTRGYLSEVVEQYRSCAWYDGDDQDDFSLFVAASNSEYMYFPRSSYDAESLSFERLHDVMTSSTEFFGRSITFRQATWTSYEHGALVSVQGSNDSGVLEYLHELDSVLYPARRHSAGSIRGASTLKDLSLDGRPVSINDLVGSQSQSVRRAISKIVSGFPSGRVIALKEALAIISDQDRVDRDRELEEIFDGV